MQPQEAKISERKIEDIFSSWYSQKVAKSVERIWSLALRSSILASTNSKHLSNDLEGHAFCFWNL